jgi:nitrogen fixation protein FixH
MPGRRPDGWWYPWIFVAGMLVVVVVNAVMITYAIGTFPGLQTEDAYRKGLAYNRTLAAAREQEERGWQATVRFEADRPEADYQAGAQRAGDLQISLTDRARPCPA